MPEQRINQIGSTGLNTDVAQTDLPPTAVTKCVNVIADDGKLRTAFGTIKLFDLTTDGGTTWIEPKYQYSFKDANQNQWLIVSDGVEVWAFSPDGTPLEITPTAGGFSHGRVTFADHNTVLVVNSSESGPHYWDQAGDNKLVHFKEIGDWDAGWTCEQMLSYKYYLVALNMQEGTNRYPYKVRWSRAVAEGELPTEWIASASNDAGDDLLGDEPGEIIGGCIVRDQVWIVKEKSIYGMSFIGLPYVMQISRLTDSLGTLLPRGFAEVRGQMAVYTGTDLMLFDGAQARSLGTKRVRKKLGNMSPTEYLEASQVFFHEPSSMLYVCGIGTSDRLDIALVYSVDDDTWAERTLPSIYGMVEAFVRLEQGSLPWGADAPPIGEGPPPESGFEAGYTWSENTEVGDAHHPSTFETANEWNTGLYSSPRADIVLFPGKNVSGTMKYWVTGLFPFADGSDDAFRECYVERLGIPIEGAVGTAQVTEVFPEIEGYWQTGPNNPKALEFRLLMQDNLEESPRESAMIPLVLGQTQVLDPCMSGRYVGWRITARDGVGIWALAALTIRWQPDGER